MVAQTRGKSRKGVSKVRTTRQMQGKSVVSVGQHAENTSDLDGSRVPGHGRYAVSFGQSHV